MGSHFAILGDSPDNSVFVKLVTESPNREYEKAMAIYNVSLESGLFIAAEPLSLCTESNLLVFKRLPAFQPIDHALGKYNQSLGNRSEILFKLFYKAGEILAELHASIHLTTPCKSVTPDLYRGTSLNNSLLHDLINDGPIAHLHWDYGFSNILVIDSDEEPPQLCIIDAAPQIIRGASATDRGSIYIDIGMFLSQIYLCAFPKYYYPMYKWGLEYKISKVFLDGYENRSGIKLSSYAAYNTALLIGNLYSNLFYTENNIKSIINRTIVQRGLRRLSAVSKQSALLPDHKLS